MLLQFFKRRLRLEVGERRLTFDSIADFEFTLSSRTEVPASKIAALVKLTARDLRREATKIREAEKRFVNIFSRSLEEPGSISRHLHELGHKVFSLDHEWRLIIAALNQQTAEFSEYKKMALVKYLQYLGSRQDVLRSIYADKLERGAVDNPENPVRTSKKPSSSTFHVRPLPGRIRVSSNDCPRARRWQYVSKRTVASSSCCPVIVSS